jgi:transcriptional regulator with XRE-family HTH domain
MKVYKPEHSKSFGFVVKQLLSEKNLSQRAFANKAKLTPDYVSKLVNGKVAEPRQSARRKIAQGLEITEHELQKLISQCSNSEEPRKGTNTLTSSPQDSSSTPDPNFVGREDAIAHLNTLVNQGAKIILIHAKGGVGKTTLARKYIQQQFGSYIEFPIAKETQNITSVQSLVEERLKQLGEEPGREFGVSLDRLKRKLQTDRIGVLIDNLEPALDGNGKIIEPHRLYVELLTALANPEVQSVTLITSRECLHESAVTVQNYLLEGLDLAAWQEFFNSRNVKTDTSVLIAMHKAYGGNAKAIDLLQKSSLG